MDAKGTEAGLMAGGRPRRHVVALPFRILFRALAMLYAGFLALGVAVIFLAAPFEAPGPYALGLTLGCAVSFLKALHLERDIQRASSLEAGSRPAKALALTAQAASRIALTAGALLLALRFPAAVGVAGVTAGLASFYVASVAQAVAMARRRKARGRGRGARGARGAGAAPNPPGAPSPTGQQTPRSASQPSATRPSSWPSDGA
jgi:hypothetical protein